MKPGDLVTSGTEYDLNLWSDRYSNVYKISDSAVIITGTVPHNKVVIVLAIALKDGYEHLYDEAYILSDKCNVGWVDVNSLSSVD